MFASNLLSLLIGSLALVSAAPSAKRAPGPSCDGLGAGAFDVVPKFTLAAYFVDEPNANTTGVPLVLGAGGAIPGASFRILSTFATFPSNDFPSLSMDAGGIFAHSADGTNTATNGNVFDGTLPGFILTFPPTQPPQIYCAVASTDPHGSETGFPVLAVNGDTDSFSLCPSQSGPQNSIVYKANANSTTYFFDQCKAVHLQVIETQ